MSGPWLALLGAQGIGFAVWAILAFRWLIALRADAVVISGRSFPSLSVQFRALRSGLTDRRYGRIRVWLAVVTIVLIALSALSPFIK